LLQSAKEYAKKKRVAKKKPAPAKKKRTPKAGAKKRTYKGGDEYVPVSKSVSTPIDKEPPRPKVFEYSFFYPDNPRDDYVNRPFTMKVGEDAYRLEIVNGVVKTKIEPVAKKLYGLGWSLIHKREVTRHE
jgi:hypothetical protein